jgi:t-SNARE complex subunit (syntaxin)
MAVIDSQVVSGKSMTKKGNQTDRAIKKLRGAFQRIFYSCWLVNYPG